MIPLKYAREFFGVVGLLDEFNTYLVGKTLSIDEGGIVWIPTEDILNFIKK